MQSETFQGSSSGVDAVDHDVPSSSTSDNDDWQNHFPDGTDDDESGSSDEDGHPNNEEDENSPSEQSDGDEDDQRAMNVFVSSCSDNEPLDDVSEGSTYFSETSLESESSLEPSLESFLDSSNEDSSTRAIEDFCDEHIESGNYAQDAASYNPESSGFAEDWEGASSIMPSENTSHFHSGGSSIPKLAAFNQNAPYYPDFETPESPGFEHNYTRNNSFARNSGYPMSQPFYNGNHNHDNYTRESLISGYGTVSGAPPYNTLSSFGHSNERSPGQSIPVFSPNLTYNGPRYSSYYEHPSPSYPAPARHETLEAPRNEPSRLPHNSNNAYSSGRAFGLLAQYFGGSFSYFSHNAQRTNFGIHRSFGNGASDWIVYGFYAGHDAPGLFQYPNPRYDFPHDLYYGGSGPNRDFNPNYAGNYPPVMPANSLIHVRYSVIQNFPTYNNPNRGFPDSSAYWIGCEFNLLTIFDSYGFLIDQNDMEATIILLVSNRRRRYIPVVRLLPEEPDNEHENLPSPRPRPNDG